MGLVRSGQNQIQENAYQSGQSYPAQAEAPAGNGHVAEAGGGDRRHREIQR